LTDDYVSNFKIELIDLDIKINSLNNQLASENDGIISLEREISNLKSSFQEKNVFFLNKINKKF